MTHMTRRTFMKTSVAGAAVLAAPKTFSAQEGSGGDTTRPNVIIIYTDDQPWDTIGYYNEKGDAYTPAMDSLFKNGLVCDNACVTSTVCSPSRYTLLTGRYAGRCKAVGFMEKFPADRPHRLENRTVRLEKDPLMNVAGILNRSGYATGFVGKSHITVPDFEREQYPREADPRTDAETNGKMKRNHQKLCDSIKPYGFTWVDSVYEANLMELRNNHTFVNNLEWCTDAARRFIEEKREKPFFLYFATTAHHGPEPFRGTGKGPYRHGLDADIGYTGEGYVEETYPGLPSREEIKATALKHGASHKTANYTLLDMAVQGILDKLREHHLEEDTLIIFASDHGTGFSSKTTLYNRGMRVPMVWYWKGHIPPGHYKHLISNVDVTPTLFNLCEAEVPNDYVTDGLDYSTVLLEKRGKKLRTQLLGEIGYARGIATEDWKYIAIRYPEEVRKQIERGEPFPAWKNTRAPKKPYLVSNTNLGYVYSRGNPRYFEADQLYDLRKDPRERNNLAGEKPRQLKRMKKLLAAELKKEGRPFGEFVKMP